MGNMLGKNLFPASSGMDTNHSDTNRPRSISNGHLQVRIIRLKERLRNQKDKKHIGSSLYFKHCIALPGILFIYLLMKILCSITQIKTFKHGVTYCPAQKYKHLWKEKPMLSMQEKQTTLSSLCALESNALQTGIAGS